MHDVRMRGFRDKTKVADAIAILEKRTLALPSEVASVDGAEGRVLAAEVRAEFDVPHFARAAMDGYALQAASTADAPTVLRVIGDAFPGRPFAGGVRLGEAVRITTGAPVPNGADAVVMAELTEIEGEEHPRRVRVLQTIAARKHVGAIGEDIVRDSVIAASGRRLRPQDLGVLASAGVARIAVVRRPTAVVLITGDEILPAGSKPEGARIVDANGPMLLALARRDGVAIPSIVRVRDRRELVREALAEARADVVLVSGGSSVGPEDHAPLVLAELGEVTVHGLALRPASPAGFGFLGDRPVFLLPGNPVSCLAAYELFAGPTIRALGGLSRAWPHRKAHGVLAKPIISEVGRTDYVRALFDGKEVTPLMTSGASILSSTSRADGVVLVTDEIERLEAGESVEIFLYD